MPRDKIISRYHRVMTDILPKAVQVADEAMVFDNSHNGQGEAVPVAHVMGQYVRSFAQAEALAWPEPCLFAPSTMADYVFEQST